MTDFEGIEKIAEYGISTLKALVQSNEAITDGTIKNVIKDYLLNKITYDEAKDVFVKTFDNYKPIEQIKEIVEESKILTPIPNPPQNRCFPKKSRHWSHREDVRLFAGVYLFGLMDWNLISDFVGSGRGRQQCLQRWSRTLNPILNKDSWSKEEDDKLMKIVTEQDNISWSKTSIAMGDRSDVQCRYRYLHLCKIQNNLKSDDSDSEEVKTIKTIDIVPAVDTLPASAFFPMGVDDFLALFQRN